MGGGSGNRCKEKIGAAKSVRVVKIFVDVQPSSKQIFCFHFIQKGSRIRKNNKIYQMSCSRSSQSSSAGFIIIFLNIIVLGGSTGMVVWYHTIPTTTISIRQNAIKMRTSIYHNLPVFFTFFLTKEVAIYLGDLHAGQVTIVTLEEVTNTTSSNLPGIPDCSRG